MIDLHWLVVVVIPGEQAGFNVVHPYQNDAAEHTLHGHRTATESIADSVTVSFDSITGGTAAFHADCSTGKREAMSSSSRIVA